MRFFGHPIHTMIIHFPTALLPADLVLSILYFETGNASYGPAAFYCMIGGVALGLLAMITGLLDLLLIKKEQKDALAAGLLHGFINAVVIILYGVLAYKAWQLYPAIVKPAINTLIIKGIAVFILLVGNYIGGTLIYKHRIGIKP